MNIPEMKNKILNFVRLNGPILPVQINKIIEKDTIFAGAILSELVANKLIKISFGKVGGSPVYYVEGQESRLQMLYHHLQQKEKEAYDLLRSKRVLRDRELDPAIRIALRNIKDFAISLNVNLNTTNEIFWRWYLTADSEAEALINNFIEKVKPIEIPITLPKPAEVQTKTLPEKIIEVKKEEVKEKKKELKKVKDDLFIENVEDYIKTKKVKVINEISKKGKEIEMIVEVQSELGNLNFLLIAKDKKKINEADLSLAHNKGQGHKLPVLFLSNGELSKKSMSYIEKNLNGLLVFKKI